MAVDPQAHLTERGGLHKLSARNDSLGFSGGARDNLVVTIDQITLNSWHEVSLQHYAAGGDTLIQCLKNVLAQVAINLRNCRISE